MLAGSQSLRSCQAGPLEVEQVIGVLRLASQQIQPPSEEASPLANDYAVGPALRDVDVRRYGVRGVEQAGLVAARNTNDRTRIVEDISTRRHVGTRRDEAR